MAERQAKRQREDENQENIQEEKRHKSNHTLEEKEEQEEEVSPQELTALLTTLEEDDFFNPLQGPNSEPDPTYQTLDSTTAESSSNEDDEDEKERVIRHLLEASDDELGLPNKVDFKDFSGGPVDLVNSPFSFCDGLWELEDEAANYYTLLQAELFM